MFIKKVLLKSAATFYIYWINAIAVKLWENGILRSTIWSRHVLAMRLSVCLFTQTDYVKILKRTNWYILGKGPKL